MKKTIIFLLFVLSIVNQVQSSEMQLSGGLEFGFGSFKVDNDFGFNYSANYLLCNENSTSVFFAPGLSFMVRVFPDDTGNFTSGFIFSDNVVLITNLKQTGTAKINSNNLLLNTVQKFSDSYSIFSDDISITIMSFDIGSSSRIRISKRLNFYADIGINFTIMNSEFEDDTFYYWGFGIFFNLALQINLTEIMYLEFGINSIINIFSHQEGSYVNIVPNQKVNYEDTGKFDLMSTAPYIHIGWRFDLEKLRKAN
jgi:hypothetical protein